MIELLAAVAIVLALCVVAYKLPLVGLAITFIGIAFAIYGITRPDSGYLPGFEREVGFFVLGCTVPVLIVAATRIYTRKRAVVPAS